MTFKQVFPASGGVRRRFAARVAAGAALAAGVTVLVLTLLAIAPQRTPSRETALARAPIVSPEAARAARRREHMARLARWREIRREARAAGAQQGGSAVTPARVTTRPDSARGTAGSAPGS